MSQVLVLNYDFKPINVTSVKRGFLLVHKGKAEIIKSDESYIITEYKKYVKPLIIRLLNYIKYSLKELKVNRKRIFSRDNYECVYCGYKKNLTIDHVLPKSRGGRNEWTNLVTSCFRCNLKKGDRTPEEAKMEMNSKPHIPKLIVENTKLQKIWDEYKNSFV